MTTRISLTVLLFIAGVGLGWFRLWDRSGKSGKESAALASPSDVNNRELETGPFDELLEEDQRLRRSGTAELLQWLDALKGDPDTGTAARIVRRWAELAPAEALTYLKTAPELESLISVVMEHWAAVDWRAAVNAASGEKDVNGYLIGGLAAGLSEEVVFEAFGLLRSRMGDDRNLAALFDKLGAVDGERAMELALNFRPVGDLFYSRNNAINLVLNGWFRSAGKPDQILDWCSGKNAVVQQGVYAGLFKVWSKTEPAKALDALWSHLDLSDSLAIYQMQPATEVDIRSCIAWVGENVESPDTALRMVNQFLDPSQQVLNPGAAMEAVELLDSELRDGSANSIDYAIRNWLGRDEAAAMNWLHKVPDGWLKGVAEGAAVKNAESAQYSDVGVLKEALRTSLSADNAEHYISKLLQERVDEGASLDAVRSVAKSLLDDSPEALRAFVRQFQETAPVETLDFIMESDHPEKSYYLEKPLVHWANQDPVAASEWVAALPEGDSHNTGLLNVATAWADIDRSGVQKWFESLPDRDKATLLIAGTHSEVSIVSTEQVLASIHSIDDSDKRRDVAQSALMSLAADDPQAAQARLDSIGLDEAGVTTIRNHLDEASALRKWLEEREKE